MIPSGCEQCFAVDDNLDTVFLKTDGTIFNPTAGALYLEIPSEPGATKTHCLHPGDSIDISVIGDNQAIRIRKEPRRT